MNFNLMDIYIYIYIYKHGSHINTLKKDKINDSLKIVYI
jgi:hypothetical protein